MKLKDMDDESFAIIFTMIPFLIMLVYILGSILLYNIEETKQIETNKITILDEIKYEIDYENKTHKSFDKKDLSAGEMAFAIGIIGR